METQKEAVKIEVRPELFEEPENNSDFSSRTENNLETCWTTTGSPPEKLKQRLSIGLIEQMVLNLRTECFGEVQIEVGQGIHIFEAELQVPDTNRLKKVEETLRVLETLTQTLAKESPKANLVILYHHLH